MNEILKTEEFNSWLESLDKRLRVKVETRISMMEIGNFGDHKRLTEIIYETRIHVPSGIRLYYMWRGKEIILMIGGGNKNSQRKDIDRAKSVASRILEKEDEYL